MKNSQDIIKSQEEDLVLLTEENEKLKLNIQELDPKLKSYENSYEQFEIKACFFVIYTEFLK